MKNENFVKKAIEYFQRGEFFQAKLYYQKAAALYGEHLFKNNILLCELRIENEVALTDVINSKEQSDANSIKNIVLSNKEKKLIAQLICKPLDTVGAVVKLKADITYKAKTMSEQYKVVILFDCFDMNGIRIDEVKGVGVSAVFKQHFRYLSTGSKESNNHIQKTLEIQLPKNTASIDIYIACLGLRQKESVSIQIESCVNNGKNLASVKSAISVGARISDPIIQAPYVKRYTSELVVASILDEFTTECLTHEVNLIKLTLEGWRHQLEIYKPDFLLVESCWRGNDGEWGALTKGSGGGKKLSGLLRYCKDSNIPTVFWNKEDPPHYDKFGPMAKFFDLAITTDINMTMRYKEDYGVDVYPLSFAAQPRIHNPKARSPRSDKAVFAGSYYSDKPKRSLDFNEIMSQVRKSGIEYDIYDRNYNKNIEKFSFPEVYKKNIVGNLAPNEVWKAHQGYKYQINMNTVQDSPTMFARRVYESLASGTPVISNDSVGMRELFDDIVIVGDSEVSISSKLRLLEESTESYYELARRGVRAVMRKHTYGHRMKSICQWLGIDVDIFIPRVSLVLRAASVRDVEKAKEIFNSQTASNKHLIIELDNFDKAYEYLNQSDDNITFLMTLGCDFYEKEFDCYKTELVLKHNIQDELANEALEDFMYWGKI
ncbi:glycosyltransferase [Neisseriaceae bacterium CLB008]